VRENSKSAIPTIPEQHEPANTEVSRRGFLTKALGGAAITGTAGFASVAMSESAHAQWGGGGHVWKSTARYQDRPNGWQQCAGCAHFRGPDSCEIVEWPIRPDGWCRYFVPRPVGYYRGPPRGGPVPGTRAY
jgi:hypothetical protein